MKRAIFAQLISATSAQASQVTRRQILVGMSAAAASTQVAFVPRPTSPTDFELISASNYVPYEVEAFAARFSHVPISYPHFPQGFPGGAASLREAMRLYQLTYEDLSALLEPEASPALFESAMQKISQRQGAAQVVLTEAEEDSLKEKLPQILNAVLPPADCEQELDRLPYPL